MNKYYLVILGLLIVITFTACNYNKGAANPPKVLITSGDKEIPYVVGLNQWNGSIYDREDTFQTIVKKDSGIEIPYIQLGESIQIEFKGVTPDKLELKDYILTENGTPKYTGKEVKAKVIDRKITFKLDAHMAAMLSSNSKDYEPGKILRGFKLTCRWGDNESEYGFIITTDARQ